MKDATDAAGYLQTVTNLIRDPGVRSGATLPRLPPELLQVVHDTFTGALNRLVTLAIVLC
jgi:hypothetical protein